MNLREAERLAGEVVEWLTPGCERIAIAGSVRRQRPEVRDLEIVAIPKPGPRPVFGEPAYATALDAVLARLVQQWQLRWDRETPRNGPKYKRLVHAGTRQKIDLFLATPDNYGYILAIRTGDADFSRALVLKASAGGLMPRGYFHHEGRLKHLERGIIETPTEESYFRELVISPAPEPQERNAETAERLARQRRVMA